MHFATLVDKRPPGVVLSPSQIDRYDQCQRRWALEYIGGFRPPPHPSAQDGTDVHAMLEAWLLYATPPPVEHKNQRIARLARLAQKMLLQLPPPGTGFVEKECFFVTRNGFSYTAKIDWLGIFFNWPTVIDHKTTKSFGWLKTPEALHNDVQANTYALIGALAYSVDKTQLFWNYGLTKGEPLAQPSQTTLHLPVVVEKFERCVEPVAHEMVSHRLANTDPLSFPPTLSSCDSYGGCPHRGVRCHVTEEERHAYAMSTQPPNLAERMASVPPHGTSFQQPQGFAPPQQQFVPQQPQGFAPPQQQQQFAPPQSFAPPGGGGFVPPGGGQPQMLPGNVQQLTGGFAPPQQQGFPAPSPQGQFAPPQGAPRLALPQGGGGYPQTPGQGFQPPAGGFQPPSQQVFSPNAGPNAPENGQQVPPAPLPTEGKNRGAGRPPGAKNKAKGETSEVSAQEVYLRAMCARIASSAWDGTDAQLAQVAESAVRTFETRFPRGGE